MVLNPYARSWYPDPHKSSSLLEDAFEGENLPFPHLPMVSIYLPNQFLYATAAACPVTYPIYFYYQYPGFQLYYQPVVADDGLVMVEIGNDVMKKKLLDSSEELKGLLAISTVYETPKDARRSVPPRLKRGYSEDVGGKKLQKPKISADGAHPVRKFVPLASRLKENFPFCNYTTVMIKNIPNKYRRNSFMEFLDKCCLGHQLEYDFLYLPMDFKTGDNLGYAFVNCTSASAAQTMKEVFQGYKWGCFETSHGTYISKKISDAVWAKIQGKDALIGHFTKSTFSCDNYEYLPVVISPPRDGSTLATSLTTIGDLRGCSNCNFKN